MKILNESLFKVGDHCLVFNSKEWSKTGDIGDNSQFYQPAKVIAVWQTNDSFKEWIADVEWDKGGRSFGHFQVGMKTIK